MRVRFPPGAPMASLSTNTISLLEGVDVITRSPLSAGGDNLEVSRTVSAMGKVYEKIRNAIEFNDEHIIRRQAIARIVRRRLAFNKSLTDESASIAREIIWAGYFTPEKVSETTVEHLEKIIAWYIQLRDVVIKGEAENRKTELASFIIDLMVCQIEELFAEKEFAYNKLFTFYMYQVLNPTIEIKGLDEEEKNMRFYVATERILLKSDNSYLRFHIMKLLYDPLLKLKPSEFASHAMEYRSAISFVDTSLQKPIDRKLKAFLKNQRPPYLVLQELILNKETASIEKLSDDSFVEQTVDTVCRSRYEVLRQKVRRAGVRSIIYIFLTKVIFILLLEFPAMWLMNEQINPMVVAIELLFPVLLMALLVMTVSIPGDENTQRILLRIRTFLYGTNQQKMLFKNKREVKRGLFNELTFALFYIVTFGTTFLVINAALDALDFTILNKFIFFFFVTAVSFFGYRVRQIVRDYQIKEKESALTPVFDFFMVPLITVGKWLSGEISKINVLVFFFDFIIEAPFKVVFEVVEDWISFLRNRKEEIV